MQNPFTTTFSKIPDHTYIMTEQVQDIIENFSYDSPSESLYKITGVRGSGKTVLLAKIEEELSSSERKKEGWLVYRISPARDMLKQLASLLYRENGIKTRHKSKNISVSANIMGNGGSVGIAEAESDIYTDIGVELDVMLQQATAKKKKIFVGIDEVSKTPEMIVFAAEFGKWLRAKYSIFMVCTGLYENIEQLYNVKNLTFFRRASTVKTEPLNLIRMTEMYKLRLSISNDEAKKYATLTKGYPYAFQELGTLLFKKQKSDDFNDIIEMLKSELFSYSYEKIWEEMSMEDRALARLLTDKKEYKRDEILERMEKPANYSTYRDRLLRRGIIVARQGFISLSLPFFQDYVKEYC
ncbi:MAG: hypothetical protein IJ608_09295 [Lachnospiraceae bacterium]|nr:hypothetical protein [Lachnospiraceae bacterium]